MDVIVFGNSALDIVCLTIDDVPRYDSLAFEHSLITPGGCASNVALGLSALGLSTTLVTCVGNDPAAVVLESCWQANHLDLTWLQRLPGATGCSIALVDSQRQPRFLHSHGANVSLVVEHLPVESLARQGARALHVAGFFVLPGLLDGRLPALLARAQALGLYTSLDVVRSPAMDAPDPLYPCLPYLDVFFSNDYEAGKLSGQKDPVVAARALQDMGARSVVVKRGAQGCTLAGPGISASFPVEPVEVVDTTGAGDAFDAAFLAARLQGADLPDACLAGNEAGARTVGGLGVLAGWNLAYG